jgi:hypothetical protein
MDGSLADAVASSTNDRSAETGTSGLRADERLVLNVLKKRNRIQKRRVIARKPAKRAA